MDVYFDNAATTKPFEEVVNIMLKTYQQDYGNPSSMHRKGVEAENYIKEARRILKGSLKVDEKEIIFTSGGTEANNLAIIGTALANIRSGKHVITTMIEHPSVYSTFYYLKELGFEITHLPVDENGYISLETLEKEIRPDTILISIMHVNNEIGTVQPIEQIGQVIKKCNSRTLFHVDAIQSFGKLLIYPKRMNIDLLSISGHKFHGPKGVGALFIREKVKIKPIIHGGNHQFGYRSGTENVAGVAGMAKALQVLDVSYPDKTSYLFSLKEYFIEEIKKVDNAIVNSQSEGFAPHIVSVSFQNIRSEVMLHALEDKGIYVSSGSACSSNKPGISNTLTAIGLQREYLDTTIRFSFSVLNTKEEVDYCIQTLIELVPFLGRYVRGGKKHV